MAKEIDVLAIQDAVRKKYAAVSSSVAGKFSYATGRAGAMLLGYDPAMASAMPDEVLEAFLRGGEPVLSGGNRAG